MAGSGTSAVENGLPGSAGAGAPVAMHAGTPGHKTATKCYRRNPTLAGTLEVSGPSYNDELSGRARPSSGYASSRLPDSHEGEGPTLRGRSYFEWIVARMRACISRGLSLSGAPTARGRTAHARLYAIAFEWLSATCDQASLLLSAGSAICLPINAANSTATLHHHAGSRRQSGVNSGPRLALSREMRGRRIGRGGSQANSRRAQHVACLRQ